MHQQNLDFGLSITTPPAVEPPSLDEAKAHLNVTHTADDA